MSDQTPANWVADPTDPTGARRRYWDGSQWTDWVMLPGEEQPTELSVADAQAAAASAAPAGETFTPDGTAPEAAQPAEAHPQAAPTERIDYQQPADAQAIPYTNIPDSTMGQPGYAAQPAEPKKSRTGLILGIVGGVGVLLLLIAIGIGFAANKATDALEDAAQDVVDDLNDAADDLADATAEPTEDAADDTTDSDSENVADGEIVSSRVVAEMSRDEYTVYAASVSTSMTEDDWDAMFWLVDTDVDTAGGLFLGMLDTFGIESLTESEQLELAHLTCEGLSDEVIGDSVAYGEFISSVVTDAGFDPLEDFEALFPPSTAYMLCPEWTDAVFQMGEA